MVQRTRLVDAVLAVVGAMAAAGCSQAPSWYALKAEGMPEAQNAQRTKAEQARDALAKRLLGELTAALAESPAHAIEVCRQRAPELAAAVGKQFGVGIGRTSLQLRNPSNQPPEWAVGHIEKAQPQPAWFSGPDGQLGALYPIVTMPLCAQCHGKDDQVTPAVRDALRVNYPRDRATGFAVGDLRGWFWVEVRG